MLSVANVLMPCSLTHSDTTRTSSGSGSSVCDAMHNLDGLTYLHT